MQDIDSSHSELRHRKKTDASTAFNDNLATVQDEDIIRREENYKKDKETLSSLATEKGVSTSSVLLHRLNLVVGVIVMLLAGYITALYLHTVHENQLWFSNIKEVEREISFRTESGLYYSYYKQLVSAPSLSQGLYELTHDNLTEHLHTVNILARFNIYQEVLLAVLYRTLPFLQTWLHPIFFYVSALFALQGLLVCALYSISWQLTGSWLTGALTACFYIFNRVDTTRVTVALALRENFALPFLWVQLAFLTCYFKTDTPRWKQRVCVCGATVSTFLFSVCWQFNQFVLLLQAMTLFGLQLLQAVPHQKICVVYIIQAVSMLLVCGAQFFNKMIITSLLFSFLPAALLVMALQSRLSQRSCGLKTRLLRMLGYIVLVFALMAAFYKFIKVLVWQEADEHIIKFVQAKFGMEDSFDFHVGLYLCSGGFGWLDWEICTRLLENLTLPLYVMAHIVSLAALAVDLVQQHSQVADKDMPVEAKNGHISSTRSEFAFHTVQCAFLGAMAVTTLRMKFLWAPYVCLLASVCVSDSTTYRWLLTRFLKKTDAMVEIIRHSITIAVLAVVVYKVLPSLLKQLEYLGEFYDPDTVDLMQWIIKQAPSGAAFAGSMQLMAGVKLCTGRPITNHPHYEDKLLRERSLELYQVYGRRSAEDVHAVLQKYNASYVILEDSICLRPMKDGCGLPNLIDAHYSQKSGDTHSSGLDQMQIPRFCDEVRNLKPGYKRYFQLVFHNRTFRVYKVL